MLLSARITYILPSHSIQYPDEKKVFLTIAAELVKQEFGENCGLISCQQKAAAAERKSHPEQK